MNSHSKQLPWYQDLKWRNWIKTLFSTAARNKTYWLTICEDEVIAAVDRKSKRLLLSKNLIPLGTGPYRFDTEDAHERFSRLLRGLITHEAGHVQFSDPKPEGQVGEIWNMLEDERMERCMVRRFPELYGDYTFLGDVMLERSWEKDRPVDLLNACLLWRWAHDRGDIQFVTEDDELWTRELRPRVEAAWESSRQDVARLAQEIYDLLPEAARQQSPMPTSAGGGGENQEQTEEGKNSAPEEGKATEGESSREGEGEAAEGEKSGTPGEGEHGKEANAVTSQPDSVGGLFPSPPRQDMVSEDPSGAIEGLARRLAHVLAPPTRPLGTRSHRTKGRFSYERYQQQKEQYFRHKEKPEKPDRYVLKLGIDISGSMRDGFLEAAKKAALMVIRAAELSQGRTDLIAFNANCYSIGPYGASYKRQQKAVLGLYAEGGTCVAKALEKLLLHTAAPGEEEIIILISDGSINATDKEDCELLMKNEKRLVIPILIGEGNENSEGWKEVFGQAKGLSNPEEIANAVYNSIQRHRMHQQF